MLCEQAKMGEDGVLAEYLQKILQERCLSHEKNADL